MNSIKQDGRDDTSVAGITEARRNFPEHPPAANDNGGGGPWPRLPFPEAVFSTLSEHQELNRQPFTESACSWRSKAGALIYASAVSIATIGWLYLLWLALTSTAQAILN